MRNNGHLVIYRQTCRENVLSRAEARRILPRQARNMKDV
jgi:hypothetical protein